VRCTGTGRGVRGRAERSVRVRRVRTSVSVYSRSFFSYTPLSGGLLGSSSFRRIVSAGKKTLESELARTRGIRLSN